MSARKIASCVPSGEISQSSEVGVESKSNLVNSEPAPLIGSKDRNLRCFQVIARDHGVGGHEVPNCEPVLRFVRAKHSSFRECATEGDRRVEHTWQRLGTEPASLRHRFFLDFQTEVRCEITATSAAVTFSVNWTSAGGTPASCRGCRSQSWVLATRWQAGNARAARGRPARKGGGCRVSFRIESETADS